MLLTFLESKQKLDDDKGDVANSISKAQEKLSRQYNSSTD